MTMSACAVRQAFQTLCFGRKLGRGERRVGVHYRRDDLQGQRQPHGRCGQPRGRLPVTGDPGYTWQKPDSLPPAQW
jgi:hypothetical protein